MNFDFQDDDGLKNEMVRFCYMIDWKKLVVMSNDFDFACLESMICKRRLCDFGFTGSRYCKGYMGIDVDDLVSHVHLHLQS